MIINPFFKRLQRLIDLVFLLLLLLSKTFNKQLTQNKMKHYLIVLVALFISSSAIFAKENTLNKNAQNPGCLRGLNEQDIDKLILERFEFMFISNNEIV